MTDQHQTPTATDYIKQLFSPATLAAFRYFLAMMSPVVAMFGFTGLTPDRIDTWVAYAKTFGTGALALMALLGIVIPLAVALLGILSATIKKQIARVRELANNPQLASEAAQKAIVDATNAIAGNPANMSSVAAVKALVDATRTIAQAPGAQSADAGQALVDATISLPQVQTIVTDAKTAAASTSESVVSADQHDVVKVAG